MEPSDLGCGLITSSILPTARLVWCIGKLLEGNRSNDKCFSVIHTVAKSFNFVILRFFTDFSLKQWG